MTRTFLIPSPDHPLFASIHDSLVAKRAWPRWAWIGLLALVATGPGGCSNNREVFCDPPGAEIRLRLPGGSSSLGAVTVSDACSVDGPPPTCQPEVLSCDGGSCACDVSVNLRLDPASTHCRIAATSERGAMFQVDVPLTYSPAGSGPCSTNGVGPVDVNQWNITVEFFDGGVSDAN